MKTIYFTVSIVLFGCSSEKQVDSTTDTAVEPAEIISPTLGDWKFSALEFSEDACNFDLSELYSTTAFEANVYTLTEVTDTQVQYVDLYNITFACDRDGNVITCPSTFTFALETYNDEEGNLVVDEDGNAIPPDATNTITTEFVTTFTAAESGTLRATMTASCEGEDCEGIYADAGVTDNPCSSSLSGITTLQ